MKKALPVSLATTTLTDEELETVVSNCEAFLNNRPLTTMSADPGDLVPLTPFHFLIGSQNLPEKIATDLDDRPPFRMRWSLIQHLSNSIWKRFFEEYVPTLQSRAKWFHADHGPKVGDVVVIVDERVPRSTWKLGLVKKLYRGLDSNVRVAQVYSGYKLINRAVERLVPLDINETQAD